MPTILLRVGGGGLDPKYQSGLCAVRGIQVGRVWVNAYHLYPAHSTFGGYKESGLGRENHRLALEHYQQVKAVVTSYSEKALGLF